MRTFVTFINESSHIVSVDFDKPLGDGWCKLEDFTVPPRGSILFHYEGLGLLIDKAVVTFDSRITILHEKHWDNEIDSANGFRNICNTQAPWWEKKEHNKVGYQTWFTYRFTDADYDYAVTRSSETLPPTEVRALP